MEAPDEPASGKREPAMKVLVLPICLALGAPAPAEVSKDDIQKLLERGSSEAEIRNFIETHRPVLPLSAIDLADLWSSGASAGLLEFLITPGGVPAIPARTEVPPVPGPGPFPDGPAPPDALPDDSGSRTSSSGPPATARHLSRRTPLLPPEPGALDRPLPQSLLSQPGAAGPVEEGPWGPARPGDQASASFRR